MPIGYIIYITVLALIVLYLLICFIIDYFDETEYEYENAKDFPKWNAIYWLWHLTARKENIK